MSRAGTTLCKTTENRVQEMCRCEFQSSYGRARCVVKGVIDGGAGACLRRVGGQEDYLGELGEGKMEMSNG